MCPGTIAIAALATATVSTGVSIYNGQQMAKEQRAANNMQRQQADLAAARQQRDAVRQSRSAYANSQAASERQGVSMSSSAQGGQGSIVSQIGDTLSFLDKYNYFSDQASMHLGKAVSYEANAKTASDVAGLSMNVFSNSAGISKSFHSIFKGPAPTGGG